MELMQRLFRDLAAEGTSIRPDPSEGGGENYIDTFRGRPLTPPTRLLMTPEAFAGHVWSLAAEEYATGRLEFDEKRLIAAYGLFHVHFEEEFAVSGPRVAVLEITSGGLKVTLREDPAQPTLADVEGQPSTTTRPPHHGRSADRNPGRHAAGAPGSRVGRIRRMQLMERLFRDLASMATSIHPGPSEGEYYVDTFRGRPLIPPAQLLMTPEGFDAHLWSIAASDYAEGRLDKERLIAAYEMFRVRFDEVFLASDLRIAVLELTSGLKTTRREDFTEPTLTYVEGGHWTATRPPQT
jgi:hypothetical protein